MIAASSGGTTVARSAIVALALLALVAVLLFGAAVASHRAWRRLSAQVDPGNGIPNATIEDYATRRLARGSMPPPLLTPHVPLALRERLRALTPRPIDTRWDLSWDLSERDT